MLERNKIRYEKIKQLHSDGMSYRQIAKQYNMTFQNVCRIVRDIRRSSTYEENKISYIRRLAKSVAIEQGIDIATSYDKYGVSYKRVPKK